MKKTPSVQLHSEKVANYLIIKAPNCAIYCAITVQFGIRIAHLNN